MFGKWAKDGFSRGFHETPLQFQFYFGGEGRVGGGGRAGTEVRELASHQCRLGLILGLEVIRIDFVVGSL